MSMAEPVYPNNETRFPAYPQADAPLPEYEVYSAAVVACETRPNARLNSTAETIGSAMGSAMERVRQLPDRLQEMKQRFTVIRGRVQEDARSKAAEAMAELKGRAQETVQQARSRAERLAQQSPFAVIGAWRLRAWCWALLCACGGIMPINEMNGRSLAGVVAELKDEMKEFFSTRLAMLRSEINDKLSAWKTALPMIVIGLALLGTCWLLLTGALVAAIAVAFEGNPFAPAIALAIVGVLYAVAGGVAVVFAWRDISEHGVVPERTLRVLKDDQLWIRNQAKVQL